MSANDIRKALTADHERRINRACANVDSGKPEPIKRGWADLRAMAAEIGCTVREMIDAARGRDLGC